MKLLLENWRKYIKEGEAEHFPWLKEIQAANSLEDIWDILESDLFKKVGSGAFRRVFSPANDPEYVIKVINENDPDKMQMNKDDFDTAKRYPLIFPKGYAHADDFSWVVVENTPPLVDSEDMQKVLDKSFPAEQEAILGAQELMPDDFNLADPFHIMKMIMASFQSDRDIREALTPTLVTARHGRATEKDTGLAQDLQRTLHPLARGWFAGKAAMGNTYQELSKAMHEFEIDKAELGAGNIGRDKDYNFKIIDSSVFDSTPDNEE